MEARETAHPHSRRLLQKPRDSLPFNCERCKRGVAIGVESGACAAHPVRQPARPTPRVMATRKSQLSEEARFRILRLLDHNPNLSQRELARGAGVSVGTAHYVLNALIERGMVKIARFRASDDKRRYAYVLTPKGASAKAAIMQQFLARKVEEHEALRREIDLLQRELRQQEGGSGKPTINVMASRKTR